VVIAQKLIRFLPGPVQNTVNALFTGDGERARSGRHALAAFIIRVVSAGIAFASQVLLARWMGSFDFGLFTTAWVWITVLGTLVTLGFSTSVIRFLPEYREHDKPEEARGFLHVGRVVSVTTGAVAMAGGWLLLASGMVSGPLVVPLALVLAALPAYALTDFQDGIGRAKGWIDLALLPPYVFRPILLFAFIIVVLLEGYGSSASSAAMAAVAATWVTAAIQYFLQKRRMARELPDGPRRYMTGHWIRQSLPLLMLEGFALLMLNLDILLLNLFVTPDQVGIYFAALRTISLVSFIHFAVGAVAMTKFSTLHAAGRKADIYPTLRDMQRWTFWPSLGIIAALLALGYPLLWLFGPEFTAAYPVMFILAAGLLVRAVAGPAQNLLVVTGHQKTTAGILMLTVALNTVLNLLLIPIWGIIGAAVATAAAFMFEAVFTMAVTNRRFKPEGAAHGSS
jgi:O-antigen/teichoic acid export membrane protein